MAKIRPGRVLLGGLVAGLIIIVGEYVLNGIILAEHWARMRLDFGIGAPGAAQFVVGGLITLSYGVVLIWMYAAMRPRFGSDLKTILAAAYTFWFIAYGLFLLSVWTNGFVTAEIALISIAWGLVEAPLAALAGVTVYRSGQGSWRSAGRS